MYVPLVGLSMIVAWGAADLAARWRWGSFALRAAAIGAVSMLALAASAQVSYWRDSVALFERAVAVTANNAVMHGHLSAALLERGLVLEAEEHAREATRIAPDEVTSHLQMAAVLEARGDLDALIRRYQRILRLDTSFRAVDVVHTNLGFALIQAGRFAEARPHLERAVSSPVMPEYKYVGLALIASGLDRPEDAVRYYREALELNPRMRFAANNLAWILATSEDAGLRDPGESVRIAEAALRETNGSDPVLLNTLAAAYEAAGRREEAAAAAARAAAAAGAAGVPRAYPISQMFLDLRAQAPGREPDEVSGRALRSE